MNIIKGNAYLLIASFIWGTAFVAQAVGMEFVGPVTFTFARFLLGALVILPLLIYYEREVYIRILTQKNSILLIFSTALALGFGATIQQYALLYTDVSNAAFITALYVPMVPIILKIILKKNLHWSIWLAVIICLIGLYLLTSNSKTTIGSFSDILLIISALFFAIQIILNDVYIKKNKSPFTFAFFQYLIIFVCTFILANIIENPSLRSIYKEGFEIFYAGALSVGIAYTLQIIGQNKTKPASAAIILSMEAVFAAIAGWIIINQTMSIIKIIGCILIFIGIIIAQLFPLLYRRVK